MKNQLILLGVGILIGAILFWKAAPKQTITKTEIKTETDTVYITRVDTIIFTKTEIRHEYLRDTILINPIKPEIKAFTASKSYLNGNILVNGEVLGEVLKLDIRNDFSYPSITNTITKTNTILKKNNGLFVTAGIDQDIKPNLGALLLRDQLIFQYQYRFDQGHSIGVGRRLF